MRQRIESSAIQTKARKSFHIQAVFATAFLSLTSGVFLSGFAIYMGANDLLVSYISMITNICGISILFFSNIVEKFHSFKKIAISLTVFSKLATLLIVLIPLFVPSKSQLAIFVPLMIIAFTLQAQTTVVLNNWMVTFVDEMQSGKYIAKRQVFVLAMTVIISLAGGRWLDVAKGAYIGFAVLFLVAFLMAIFEILSLLHMPDAIQQKNTREQSKFLDMLKVPAKCKPFFTFVVYIFLFYLMLSFADSFTIVYMMRYLKLPFATITAMQMIIWLPQIFLLGVWGRISDRKGHQFTLTASIWFLAGQMLFLAFTNAQNYYSMIPISFLFAAIGNSAFIVSIFNRRYELMPQKGRVQYDNFFSAAVGLAVILGPITGGIIKKILESSEWITQTIQFGNIRLLYVFSAFAMVILQVAFTIRHAKAFLTTLKNRKYKNS